MATAQSTFTRKFLIIEVLCVKMKKTILILLCVQIIAFHAHSQVSVIGTATPANNWTFLYTMNGDPDNENGWIISLYLSVGQIKFIDHAATDTIGGENFPQGIGVVDGPAINIPESGFYKITYDTATMEYAFLKGMVGINTVSPYTTLEVAGGISSRSVLGYVDNDSINVPENINLFILTGGLAMYDTLEVILPPTTFVDGLRLVILNVSDQMAHINVEYRDVYIPTGYNAEFLLTYYSGWRHLSSSQSAIGIGNWQTMGNAGTNPSNDFIGTTDATGLTIKTSDTPRIQISADGNVGIGSDPLSNQMLRAESSRLQITGHFHNTEAELGNNGSSVAVYGSNLSGTNGANYGGLFESNGFNSSSLGDNIGIAAIANSSPNQNIGLLARGTDLAAHFDLGKVLIDENLGIGIMPFSNTRLLVDKPANLYSAATFNFPLDGDLNSVIIGKKLSPSEDMAGLWIDVENTYDSIAIWAKGKAFILNDLSVGGGYVPPGYTMAVDGKVIAEEVRVQNSLDWPDYVFADHYPLRSIQEVEAFIQNNKHLPEVPSAKNVEVEGIMLGEMQATLLKKIEELTLYLISQQKEIEELKVQVSLLKTAQN